MVSSKLYSFVRRAKRTLVTSIFSDQQKKIILELQVALVVNIVIRAARACCVYGSEQIEIKIILDQSVLHNLCFPRGIEVCQNLVIFSQPVVDVADEIFAVAIDLVIIGVSAIIAAEFLVDSSFQGLSAL